MNSISKKSLEYFKNNFNCAQAVLCALAPKTGLDENSSLKVATAFGGGIARNQHVCGAVSGALMAIGLVHGKGINDDDSKKKETYSLSNEFMKQFKEKHGEIDCLSILGADWHTEEGQKKIKDENLFHTKCEALVADAAAIAESLI